MLSKPRGDTPLNIENNLILVKDEDKTDEIEYCKYNNGKWSVKYFNNNKVYTYSYINLKWYSKPNIIDAEKNIVYENDQPISGIIKIIDFDQYVRLIFMAGYKKVYARSSIVIEETCLSNSASHNCFEYLKKLADIISVKNEGDIGFLSKQYARLTKISPSSVLAAYLERKPLKTDNKVTEVFFPFGFNLSQKTATERALTEQVSVIEGPPGTGKTQTILNIIANAIINNKTVAVVSNNNSATANVLEKLKKYEVDFIAAFLGNNDNKHKFFEEQKYNYPDMQEWILSNNDKRELKVKLIEIQKTLNDMLEYKNNQANLKQQLSELKVEVEYFNKYYSENNAGKLKLHSFFRLSADKILNILLEYQLNMNKGNFKLKNKLYNLFVYGIYGFEFYKNDSETVISYLQKSYYETKVKELNKQIEIINSKLNNYNFDDVMKNFSSDSMKLFKAELAKKYNAAGGNRPVFSNDVLWKNFDSFIDEYPVILSTTHSLRYCASENYLFDYVIIDEASQVDLVTGALALSCAKNAVIVGDVKQLPNVVSDETAKTTKQIFEEYDLDNAYSYAENSLLSSFIKLYKDIPRTLLKEHYRCHPKIIGFCNQKFYNNELVILTNGQENDKPLVLYKTAKGNHARGKLNQRQIDVVFEEIIPQQNIDEKQQSVGIISPFRLQTEEMKKVIGERNIEADTVHKYQGREKDVIILTTVANDVAADDFVDNPNLINVAVSRAIEKLIIVVSEGSEDWKGTNLGDLVRYIQYNNFEINESKIYSVFDLLYSNYSEKLLGFIKNVKNVSEYESENLMNKVIENVLSLLEFQNLNRVLHLPLKMLLKDTSKLDADEIKYAMNILTHTDFVIFNKLDKMPVLVVEVDGYAYHANNPKQLQRDRMKDSILNKYNIPILRINTNGSGEEARLKQRLEEILGK